MRKARLDWLGKGWPAYHHAVGQYEERLWEQTRREYGKGRCIVVKLLEQNRSLDVMHCKHREES